MLDREKVISTFEKIISVCKEDGCDFVDITFEDAEQVLALLKEYKQSEQSYLRTLVELSNERDKLLKELGREDEHKYKDGSFMAGGNGIVKL